VCVQCVIVCYYYGAGVLCCVCVFLSENCYYRLHGYLMDYFSLSLSFSLSLGTHIHTHTHARKKHTHTDNSFLDWFDPSTESAHPVFGRVIDNYPLVQRISAVPTRDDCPITPIQMIRVTIE
jgi:hypothetical protein